MNQGKDYHELIEPYLLDALDAAAREEFEAIMAADHGLRREVELQRSLIRLVQDKEGLRLRETLEKANRTYARSRTVPLVRRALAWAATVALIVVGVTLGWLNFAPQDPHSLVEEYFEPYPIVWSQRSGEMDLRDLTVAYESANYDAALKYIEQWEQQDAPGNAATFYKGICLLALDRGVEAAVLFQRVVGEDDPLLGEQAQWYLALSRLQAEDIAEARKMFKSIAGHPGHYKRQEAEQALDRLR